MKQDPNELSALQWSIKIDGFPTGEQLYVFGEGHCLLWYSQQLIFPLFSFTSEATFRGDVIVLRSCGEVLKRTSVLTAWPEGRERNEGYGSQSALSPLGSHLFLELWPRGCAGGADMYLWLILNTCKQGATHSHPGTGAPSPRSCMLIWTTEDFLCCVQCLVTMGSSKQGLMFKSNCG